MPARSAGILLYRRLPHLQVLLVHPGGPFWAKRSAQPARGVVRDSNSDLHAWSIPKGEYNAEENPQAAALRELEEETGFRVFSELVTGMLPLGELQQKGGKLVTAFALESDFDPAQLRSNTFTLHGREYPEVDRAAWFTIPEARKKILTSQEPFLDRLVSSLAPGP